MIRIQRKLRGESSGFYGKREKNRYVGLFPIGEVARACGVSRKAILFYESRGLIAPTFVDGASGYRYYDADYIARILLQIIQFRNAGLSVAEISDYFSGGREAVAVNFRGDYRNINQAYKALGDYIRQKGLTPGGAVREYYLDGGSNANSSAERFVTRVVAPIEERRQTPAPPQLPMLWET